MDTGDFVVGEESIELVKRSLENNNFEVYVVENRGDATALFKTRIYDRDSMKSASYGDSMTLFSTGVLDFLRQEPIDFIDPFNDNVTFKDKIVKCKRALQADLFVTGSNAVTESGEIINLDMIGNRVAGITFGPRFVVLFIGVNKIVKDLSTGMSKIRESTAPLNVARHEGMNNPCVKTGQCHNCRSPQRICNVWSIVEKSFPKGRIKVILIKERLGLS